MPYSSVSELPPAVKKLPEKKQRQWMDVFNSAYKREKDKGASAKDAETTAFKEAWGAVKKGMSLAEQGELVKMLLESELENSA